MHCLKLTHTFPFFQDVTFSELYPPQYGFRTVKDLLKEVDGVSVISGGGTTPSLVLFESPWKHSVAKEEEEEEKESEGKKEEPSLLHMPSCTTACKVSDNWRE